jgi:O-antigen ligase
VIYLISRRRAKTLLLAALAIPVFLVLMPGAIWSRMEMGFGQGADAVTAGRIDGIWMPLAPELLDSPVWGKGLNSIIWSKAMIADLIHNAGHPHNAYLQAYMDLGLVGLALLVAFWIYAWRSLRRLAADNRVPNDLQGFFEGAAAGLASFLIAGMAGSSLYPVPEQCFIWMALGMMWGVQAWISKPRAS